MRVVAASCGIAAARLWAIPAPVPPAHPAWSPLPHAAPVAGGAAAPAPVWVPVPHAVPLGGGAAAAPVRAKPAQRPAWVLPGVAVALAALAVAAGGPTGGEEPAAAP